MSESGINKARARQTVHDAAVGSQVTQCEDRLSMACGWSLSPVFVL